MATLQFTKLPRRGDAVLGVKGTQGEVLYVKQESIESTADIPSDLYENEGVVLKRRGDKVLIGALAEASKKWCERYSFALTGYTLDGTSRSGVLSVREASDSWAANHDYTIEYECETAAELIETLNTYFAANTPFSTQDWVAEGDGNGGITLHFAYTDYRQSGYDTGKTGFTLTANLMPDVVALANIRRCHGGTGGEGVLSSWYRALAYFRADNSSATYNPSTDVTSKKTNYPICLPGYLGHSEYRKTGDVYDDHCAALRAIYGEGEEGWLRYMKSMLPVVPTDFGNMGMHDGLERTRVLALKRYSSLTLTDKPLCPAADYAYTYGTSCLPAGRWHLGTVEDIYDMLDGIIYNTVNDRRADPVNLTLLKLGGTAISNGSHFWSCCRCNSNYAWHAIGSSGFFNSHSMYYSLGCRPLSLLSLR